MALGVGLQTQLDWFDSSTYLKNALIAQGIVRWACSETEIMTDSYSVVSGSNPDGPA